MGRLLRRVSYHSGMTEDGRTFEKYLGKRYNVLADDWDDYLHILYRKGHFLINDWYAYISSAEEVRKSRSLNAKSMKEEDELDAESGQNIDEDEKSKSQPDTTLVNEESVNNQRPDENMATDTEKTKDKGKQKATQESDTAREQCMPQQPRISDYELKKRANIEENKRMLDILLPEGSASIFGKKEKVKRTQAPKEKQNVEPIE